MVDRGGEQSVSERLAVVESATLAITQSVRTLGDLLKDEAKESAKRNRELAESLHDIAAKQGRHDFRTMASWGGVVIAFVGTLVMPIIAFLIVIGGREVDRLDATIDSNSNTGNVIQMREQIKLNAVVANIYRDENARILKMLGDHEGVDIPPPTFYPDAQEAPSP